MIWHIAANQVLPVRTYILSLASLEQRIPSFLQNSQAMGRKVVSIRLAQNTVQRKMEAGYWVELKVTFID